MAEAATSGEKEDPGMAMALGGQDLVPADGGELQAEVTAEGIVFDIQLTRQEL